MAQVGNEAARDAIKHSAAYIIRAAVSSVVPSAGPLASVHYDKRGGKLTLPYAGADCSGEKDKVEERANQIVEQNTAINQLDMPEADKEGAKTFENKDPKDVGGVVIKKFTANAAKEQLVVEFICGKKPEPAAKKADEGGKKKGGAEKAQQQTRAPPSAYDNLQQVSGNLVEDIIQALKGEGLALDGKEERVKSLIAGTLETPLLMLKNTAYTNGHSAKITQPIGNFVVKR